MPDADLPLLLTLAEAADASVRLVGGKARSLGRLIAAGVPAPAGVVLTTQAYDRAVSGALEVRIAQEVERKRVEDSRWEELWDVSLRIKSAFVGADLPDDVTAAIDTAFDAATGGDERRPLVVRSSSPHEDSDDRSFAGLHDSVVGVVGRDAAQRAVREVWASLWSDRAIMYRAETGQDARAAMAVVVQPLATSERSGVAFTRSPVDPSLGALEAVWGLGEGLVSGDVEPDRYALSRPEGAIVDHTAPSARDRALRMSADGVELVELPATEAAQPPLDDAEASEVFRTALRAESAFRSPQDTEWTYDRGALVFTQSRPITSGLPDDHRRYYLGLRPSLARLETLARRIESEILPGMRRDARRLREMDLEALSAGQLAEHAADVAAALQRWRQAYREELIPFAHGARLFGSYYDLVVRPDDPYAFTALLARTSDELARHAELLGELGLTWELPPVDDAALAARIEGFLESVGDDERANAQRMLDIGRTSWRLRDDDNLYLELVEQQAARCLHEVNRRLAKEPAPSIRSARERLRALAGDALDSNRPPAPSGDPGERPRQLVGQPAGPGVAEGPARVVTDANGMAELRDGEVLVIDALEPQMALPAARAAGIVERRGGMLVHGAIVAREFGLPCVTGVPHATSAIRDGEALVVDGYLGIVTRSSV